MAISIIQGDITTLQVDAIVNAANTSLLGGGGVDGAIHRAAGPELKQFNARLNGCKTGEAKISPGFNLPSKYVISTVGPVWQGGDVQEAKLLESCYRNCLKLAIDNNIHSIAFPAISTGVYGFPFKEATTIALNAVNAFTTESNYNFNVFLVFFSRADFEAAEQIKAALAV